MEIRNSPEGMEQLALFPEASICSSEGPRVKVSASRESGKDSTEQADWQNRLSNFLNQCVPAGSSGKTYRGACPRSISEPGSMTSTFFSQRLQNAGILCAGEFWTLNMCEWTATLAPFLKDDGVCSLSDILLPTGVIQHRYFLSRTACSGILRRAESRGKALPEILRTALERQARSECVPENRNNGLENVICENMGQYGFDGYNQKATGDVCKTLSNSASDIDHVPLVYSIGNGQTNSLQTGNDYAETLKANCDKDRMPDNGKLNCVIDTRCKKPNGSTLVMATGQANAETATDHCVNLTCNHEAPIICAGFSGGQGKKAGGIGYREEVCPTIRSAAGSNQVPDILCQYVDVAGALTARHDSSPCVDRGANIVYENHAQDSRVKECGDIAPTVSAKAGTGGGNLPLVQECFPINGMVIGAGVRTNDRHPTWIGTDGDPIPTITKAHHHAVAIAENTIGRKENNRGNGTGALEELAYTQNATGVMGVCNITQGENQNADAEKARAVKILRLLRDEIGEKAFCEWTLGRLGSFQAEKVLQPNLHGESVRREAGEEKTRLDDSALSCAKNNAKNALRCLWEQFQPGHPSQGQELAQQFTAELNLRLSQLPHEIASVATVRRLLPIETERLMGFPDNWTRIRWKGKSESECPDSPRYKACGNSMCVNVMRWIGMRIEIAERKSNA